MTRYRPRGYVEGGRRSNPPPAIFTKTIYIMSFQIDKKYLEEMLETTLDEARKDGLAGIFRKKVDNGYIVELINYHYSSEVNLYNDKGEYQLRIFEGDFPIASDIFRQIYQEN